MPKEKLIPTNSKFTQSTRDALERVRIKLGSNNWTDTLRQLIHKEDKLN